MHNSSQGFGQRFRFGEPAPYLMKARGSPDYNGHFPFNQDQDGGNPG